MQESVHLISAVYMYVHIDSVRSMRHFSAASVLDGPTQTETIHSVKADNDDDVKRCFHALITTDCN